MSQDLYRVYLVDDDVEDLQLLAEVFAETACASEVHCFSSIEKLMLHLEGVPPKALPDIIILDHHMPLLGGDAALQMIRGQKRFSQIAVGIYSTTVQQNKIESLLLNGADFYIEKGDKLDDMKVHVEQFCQQIVEKKKAGIS